MSSETELKLGVAPSAAHEVARLAWLCELSEGRIERRKLRSVYFDTPRLELHDCGVELRVRHAGRQRLQTIKGTANGSSGSFQRGEWQHDIEGDKPDLRLAKDTLLSAFARKKKLRRKLRPIFETVVDRTIFPIRTDAAELELAIDRGHIQAKGSRRREGISEIEIELKGGDPGELSKIAKRLERSVALAYAPRSKGERGYALRCKNPDAPIHGSGSTFDGRLSAGDAFRAIGFPCLDHALANERAIRHGDPEGVHQMRVGLRRLRTAISIFKDMLRGPETEALKRELKWLTEQLSPARDFDVLIAERVRPLRGSASVGADAGVLEQDLNAKRAAGMEKANAALDSDRYRAIGLHAALWLAHGAWSRSGAPAIKRCRDLPVDEIARTILAKRSKKIVKKARKVEQLDPRARHKLRVAVKKLRYACDFFACVFPGAKRDARRKRFCKALKSLQGSLGTLNDIEVHRQFARAVVRSDAYSAARARKALAIGFIAGREDEQIAGCLAQVEKTAAKLDSLPAYWK
jgi:triphosphatase